MNRRLIAIVAAAVLVMLYMAYGSCGCGKVSEVPEVPEDVPSPEDPVQLSEVNELAALPNPAKLAPGALFEPTVAPFRIQSRSTEYIPSGNTDTMARGKITYNK